MVVGRFEGKCRTERARATSVRLNAMSGHIVELKCDYGFRISVGIHELED